MALPPKTDPLRPLFLAARSARLLGVVIVLLGILYAVIAVIAVQRPTRGTVTAMVGVVLGITAAFLVGVGVAYFIAAVYIRRRSSWAIILAMVLTSLALIAVLLGLGGNLLRGTTRAVPTIISLVFVAAFAQMLMHLIQGWRNLRNDPTLVRGFTPLMPTPVIPPPPASPPRPEEPA